MADLNINLATGAVVSQDNGTNVALNDGQTYTGATEDVSKYTSIVISAKADTGYKVFADFSVDGVNWDSTITFTAFANVNEVHRLTITRQYFRLRITNDSGENQTFLRAQVLLGSHQSLTSPLNSIIKEDADTLLVRTLNFNLSVAERLYFNREITIKDGFVAGVSTQNVPQDIWSNGSAYTGFVSTAGEAEIVVSGNDSGKLIFPILESEDSLDYEFKEFTINGAGTYALPFNIWRCNFAFFLADDKTSFNSGLITIRQTNTPSNVFVTIAPNQSQSNCSAYSVPKGSEIFIDKISGSVRGSASGSMDGQFYFQQWGESPRLRFPFELQFGALYYDNVDFLVRIREKTDICPRIIASSTNNLTAKMTYRILKVIK